ncbi:MAG TPA: Gfo/Idh/MocA family oxidoreductase [Gaiellaceae bacterium]|nr:Gfo/Idh/MocA family oxidoreductase [Gaiellaceae bacterium]
MTEPLRVGVIGCGIIGKQYLLDSGAYDAWRPVACADLDAACADAIAAEFGLRAEPVADLIADPDVDLVLNLTPPAAHAPLVRAALEAGKHAYTEKPLATTVAEGRELVAAADRSGLRLGCAPDTFLGSAYETARRLVAEGAIGTPLGAAATMLVGGPDTWHPNAEMFFRAGGGPLLDIAPYYLTALVSVLGPIEAVTGFAETPTSQRTLGAGPRTGAVIAVEVPTHAAAVLRHAGGALATLTVGFESREQYVSGMRVFGTTGSLTLPDANGFEGEVLLADGRGEQEPVAYASYGDREARGLGIQELAEALRERRPHRASGRLALHVLEAAEAIARAGEEGRVFQLAPVIG